MRNTYKSFLGYKLIEDTSLVKNGPPVEVKRTFWEKLFSLSPFVKTKIIPSKLPIETVYKSGDTLTMHPLVAKKLRFYIRCNKFSLVRLYLLQHLKESK